MERGGRVLDNRLSRILHRLQLLLLLLVRIWLLLLMMHNDWDGDKSCAWLVDIGLACRRRNPLLWRDDLLWLDVGIHACRRISWASCISRDSNRLCTSED